MHVQGGQRLGVGVEDVGGPLWVLEWGVQG